MKMIVINRKFIWTAALAAVMATACFFIAQSHGQSDLTATVKITMAGDFLLHAKVQAAAKTGENIYDYAPFLSEIKPHINGDLNITNIEGQVDGFGENRRISAYPRFNYPLALLDAVKYAGFNLVITANNHAFDNGWAGLLKTRDNLAAKGLDYIGTYAAPKEYAAPYVKEINGIRVGMTAWSALDNNLSLDGHEKYAMKKFSQHETDDLPRMLRDVATLRKAGAEVVLMALHWGEEYHDAPRETQRQIAKRLIDGGVDVLVGGHPHCVQPIEVFDTERDGAPFKAVCVYSLGNFFADQIDLGNPVTQYGMLVSLGISRDTAGTISTEHLTYMPTFCDRRNGGYILAPAGKYANADARPEGFTDPLWAKSKAAWSYVRRVVGNVGEGM
ncbi:hypothetical protein FACS189492_2720 [Clostridia bacterium]|nr:hypothetical protein FACS189492_2720 [Clostridia bacterium]